MMVEIDREFEDVGVESDVSELDHIPIQISFNNDATGEPEAEREEDKEEDKEETKNTDDSKCYYSIEQVKSRYLEKLQPMKRRLLMLKFKIRRKQLKDLLNGGTISVARRNQVLRLLWFINGAVKHNLSFRRLREVYETYERLDLVPEGYMYAALHMHSEAPLHVK